MKKLENTMWGIILITIGAILTLNVLEITDINLLFPGWWTFIIIIPAFIGLITEKEKTGNLIALVIGLLLFLCCQEVFSFFLIWKLTLPIILIILGISLLFKDSINKNTKKEIKNLNSKNNNLKEYSAVFNSQEITTGKEEYKGSSLNAIFGTLKHDLSNATLKEKTIMNISSIFGYTEIIVPKNTNIKISSTTIFGKVTNETIEMKKEDNKTIYVNITCMFGGVKIK